MLVFIDESGDPGFKTAKGSTKLFVVAMVIFDNDEKAARTQSVIREIAQKLKVRPEFKFNKCDQDRRDGFFAAVAKCKFSVRAIVVRKHLIWSDRLRSDADSFYVFFLKTMLKFDNRQLRSAKIIIDGSGNRLFRDNLKSYLKRHLDDGAIASVKMRDSKSEPLLQLADMCVGAIARSYREDRADAQRWRKMIASRISDVWEFE